MGFIVSWTQVFCGRCKRRIDTGVPRNQSNSDKGCSWPVQQGPRDADTHPPGHMAGTLRQGSHCIWTNVGGWCMLDRAEHCTRLIPPPLCVRERGNKPRISWGQAEYNAPPYPTCTSAHNGPNITFYLAKVYRDRCCVKLFCIQSNTHAADGDKQTAIPLPIQHAKLIYLFSNRALKR